MPSKYIRNLSWNPQGQYYDVEKIEFGTTYTEGSGFSPDGSIGDSTTLYSYDGDKTVTTLAKYVTRIPWTGEKGVVSLKAISYYESLTFNEATGELIAYDPSRTLVFQHYQNPDSSFQVETGRSIVWPAGYSVNHSANVDNEVTVFADKEAEYFDFESSTRGTFIDNEYSYKIRDKYDSSNRVDLANEYGVSGNFDLGWWDYISFESQAIASTTEIGGMARFGFSGDLGNVDTLTGIGWSFEGFSKGKGAKKEISLNGTVDGDGSFESNFRARGKKVKGWLNVEDIQGDGLDASFSYQGKDYDFTPGDRVKIKVSKKKGRFQVVDHDLSLDNERTPAGNEDDGLTGGGTGSTAFREWISLLDANGDGVFNSQDLLVNPGRVSLIQEAEVSPGALEALAQQENPIGSLVDVFTSPGSGFDSGELVNLFNRDVINPPNLMGDGGVLGL